MNSLKQEVHPKPLKSTGNTGIPSRQIGQSQEVKLLYEVLKQVSRLRQTLA